MTSLPQRAKDGRLVVGIAGRIGAGKTSAAKYISSTFGFQYLRYSEVLATWFAPDLKDKSELQRIGWEVMDKGLQSELNHRLIDQILPNHDAVVDGLRHPLDYKSLKFAFQSSFHLVFLDAPAETRWAHVKSAGPRRPSYESFLAADSHSVEQQIDLLKLDASLIVKNVGSISGLYTNMEDAIKQFRKEGCP
jgi:dephospho-CoA kinase